MHVCSGAGHPISSPRVVETADACPGASAGAKILCIDDDYIYPEAAF